MKKECVAMLLAGGQGSRLYVLTGNMAKPAVPFGGKFRIIDFPLSNCTNYGIDTVGVRLEHPSELIDQIQYHSRQGRGKYLPAAEYSFVTQVNKRGVYSFCMCPGGFVIPAATGPEQIVVNGMSPSNRGTRWSNSGMVVELHPEDVEGIMNGSAEAADEPAQPSALDALTVMRFQERLERDCWSFRRRRQTVPTTAHCSTTCTTSTCSLLLTAAT